MNKQIPSLYRGTENQKEARRVWPAGCGFGLSRAREVFVVVQDEDAT